MYLVRIDYRSGLHLEFGYSTLERGQNAYDSLTSLRDKGALGQFWDDAGRSAVLDCKDILSHMLVDVMQEAESFIVMQAAVRSVQERLGVLMPPAPPAPPPPRDPRMGGMVDERHEDRPSIATMHNSRRAFPE